MCGLAFHYVYIYIYCFYIFIKISICIMCVYIYKYYLYIYIFTATTFKYCIRRPCQRIPVAWNTSSFRVFSRFWPTLCLFVVVLVHYTFTKQHVTTGPEISTAKIYHKVVRGTTSMGQGKGVSSTGRVLWRRGEEEGHMDDRRGRARKFPVKWWWF